MKWKKASDSTFGTWLPFIGFRTVAFDNQDEPIDPTAPGFDSDGDYEARSVLLLGWFGWVFIIRSWAR